MPKLQVSGDSNVQQVYDWNQTNLAGRLTLPSAKSTLCQPHCSKLSISLVILVVLWEGANLPFLNTLFLKEKNIFKLCFNISANTIAG